MSAVTPPPLRVLLAWPEPAATVLWRGLQALRPQVDVTRAPVAELGDYLQVAGYYHVLHITPEQWRTMTQRQRRRCARSVALVVLGPGVSATTDLADAASVVYLPLELTPEESVASFCTLHHALSEGWSLVDIVKSSVGRLALAGVEPDWFTASQPSAAGRERTVNAVNAQGGAVAIDPGARTTNGTPGGITIEHQTAFANASIGIGTFIVKGDLVTGPKVVQHADGDQVNINRGMPAAAKLEQTAGGDQMNVNRSSGTPAAKKCAHCGQPVEAGYRFCQSCGAAQ